MKHHYRAAILRFEAQGQAIYEADGLLVRPIGHLDVLSPPLTITKEQVDFVVDTLKRAILKATAELKAEGVI